MDGISAVFLQSQTSDPYELYSRMLKDCPLFWDELNQVWAVYSYANCTSVLSNTNAVIPSAHKREVRAAMSERTGSVVDHLARISNGSSHEINREIASRLFGKMRNVNFAELLDLIIDESPDQDEMDWVTICKILPARAILSGFGFTEQDINSILPQVKAMTSLLSPSITPAQMMCLNPVIEMVYSIAEHHLVRIFSADFNHDAFPVAIANMLGLLIQSYDAGRGLLSNAFLQMIRIKERGTKLTGRIDYERFVLEVLRYDPPVHNTRRILTKNLEIEDDELKEGQRVIVVLAAANRDPVRFDRPGEFDIHRVNNGDQITLGMGAHACLAKDFSIRMASEVLQSLFAKGKTVQLLQDDLSFEPLVNVRLPKQLMCSIR